MGLLKARQWRRKMKNQPSRCPNLHSSTSSSNQVRTWVPSGRDGWFEVHEIVSVGLEICFSQSGHNHGVSGITLTLTLKNQKRWGSLLFPGERKARLENQWWAGFYLSEGDGWRALWLECDRPGRGIPRRSQTCHRPHHAGWVQKATSGQVLSLGLDTSVLVRGCSFWILPSLRMWPWEAGRTWLTLLIVLALRAEPLNCVMEKTKFSVSLVK